MLKLSFYKLILFILVLLIDKFYYLLKPKLFVLFGLFDFD